MGLDLLFADSYPPGCKENGAVFCHNNPWVICGEAELGRSNKTFDGLTVRRTGEKTMAVDGVPTEGSTIPLSHQKAVTVCVTI